MSEHFYEVAPGDFGSTELRRDPQADVYRELAEARAALEQVDNVLLVSGIAAKGDYRQAIHDLITQSIREQNDPALSRVIAEVALDASQAQCARAVEALVEITVCPTCDGTGQMQLDCPRCGGEDFGCTSKKHQGYSDKCAQCDGSGKEFSGSAKAEAVLADPSTAATAEWLREKLREAWESAYIAGASDYQANRIQRANPYAAGAPGEAKS